MKMNKKVKALMLAGVITVGIGAVGCDKKEEAPKEEVKQEQQVETKLTIEDLMKKSEVTYEDLENVAKNQLGMDSEEDGPSNYIKYDEEEEKWVYITDPAKMGNVEPNILDLEKDMQDEEIERVEFLNIFYKEFKKFNDEFIKGDLTKESAYDDYVKEYDKWMNLLNKSYIEAESGWVSKAFALVVSGLGNESTKIREMINMSGVVKDANERETNLKDMDAQRLEKRKRYDDYLKDIYDGNMEALGRNEKWNY